MAGSTRRHGRPQVLSSGRRGHSRTHPLQDFLIAPRRRRNLERNLPRSAPNNYKRIQKHNSRNNEHLHFQQERRNHSHQRTQPKTKPKSLIANFNSISQQAESIGGVENFTIQGANSQLNITAMNNLYLATVSSRAADQKIVKSLTHVLVPTVVKLVDQITPNLRKPASANQVNTQP